MLRTSHLAKATAPVVAVAVEPKQLQQVRRSYCCPARLLFVTCVMMQLPQLLEGLRLLSKRAF